MHWVNIIPPGYSAAGRLPLTLLEVNESGQRICKAESSQTFQLLSWFMKSTSPKKSLCQSMVYACIQNFRSNTVLGIEQQWSTGLKILLFLLIWECMCVHVDGPHACGAQDNLKEPVLFSHMGPRDQRRLSGTAASTFSNESTWTMPETHSIRF